MAQANLLVHPSQSADGVRHRITPQSAGWRYVGFETREMKRGARTTMETGDREICIVILAGKARVKTGDFDFWRDRRARRRVLRAALVGLCAPARQRRDRGGSRIASWRSARRRRSGAFPRASSRRTTVGTLIRGQGANARHIRNILAEEAEAESLLVVEVITPGGHWSSYPPHKHDRDALPDESYLEETYYHRLSPPQGFALQRVYTDDRSLDETMAVADRDVVLVPRGYHPVGAPHGYELYYLNTMAGPKRIWRFHNDPAHEWLMK